MEYDDEGNPFATMLLQQRDEVQTHSESVTEYDISQNYHEHVNDAGEAMAEAMEEDMSEADEAIGRHSFVTYLLFLISNVL